MKIDLLKKIPQHMDTIILLLGEGYKLDSFELLPPHVKELAEAWIEHSNFKADFAAVQSATAVHKGKKYNLIICGAGETKAMSVDKMRRLFAAVVRAAIKLKAKTLYLYQSFPISIGEEAYGHALAEAALLTEYRFFKYLSSDDKHEIDALHLVKKIKNNRQFNCGVLEGRIFAESTNFARDLVNEPANVIFPESLADLTKKAALKYGFNIEIFNAEKLRRLKMDAFLAVGKGSKSEPRLIIMRYQGNPDLRNKTIGLIGKGLTYDSGGYCIKSPQGMVSMKSDMAGAAAVIGTMIAVTSLKLKVNLVAIVAACENMISGEAYHTGDLIRSMNGKTIEVINTDAEGRLTLVDAIHYAISREKVHKVLDIATLTGAAVTALGNRISAVVTNDDAWLEMLKKASEFTGEKIWQLPAHEEYKELIKSQIADLKNSGGPVAGTISAALFIQEFVDKKPWIHIDIAGTASRDSEAGMYSVGATGVGVRLITQLLREMEQQS